MYKCETCEAPMTTIEHEWCEVCCDCIDKETDELNDLTNKLLDRMNKENL